MPIETIYIQTKLKSDPQRQWPYVHAKKGTSRIPLQMTHDGTTLGSAQNIVVGFIDIFQSG